MRIPAAVFLTAAVMIAAAWWWLGRDVAIPASPVAAGEKLHCISYAPFRGAQSPLEEGVHIGAAQIDEDLARLARVSNCVRTYSVEHGVDQVPALAGKHGLKVLQGIWLSGLPQKNEWQIETAIALVKRHPEVIAGVVVGNEVLLRGEMAGPTLAQAIRRVKGAIGDIPVTYADVWEFWLRYPEVYAAVDFVTIHILPYWEDFPIAAGHAANHVDAIRARMAAAFPEKEILIGETGWPSAGRMREGARPSRSNQALVIHQVLNAAKTGGYRVNVIEAFDQPWKRRLEGTVGGYWGLFDDVTRQPKFAWGQGVSDHPLWLWQALGGIVFAGLIVLCGGLAGGGSRLVELFGLALIAGTSGIAIGLAAEQVWVEGLGWGGWTRGVALLLLALAAPPLAAFALRGGREPPRFAQVLGAERTAGRADLILGGVLALLTVLAAQTALGLVFDPRYRDFPNAALAGPILAFAVLVWCSPGQASGEGAAERIAAVTLLGCAIYIAPNEGWANTQAQAFVALILLLALTLWRRAAGRRTG